MATYYNGPPRIPENSASNSWLNTEWRRFFHWLRRGARAVELHYFRYALEADLVGQATVNVEIDGITYHLTHRWIDDDEMHEIGTLVGVHWDGTYFDDDGTIPNMDVIVARVCPVAAPEPE